MKAVLKAPDGTVFNLAPKVTTVGREGCDVMIQIPGVDFQHAVLEYCEQEDCLILQDLNTAQGTYVNDVRVQNAAVRLASGDRIRFGYSGQAYELQVEQQSVGVTCPPVQHRQQVWSAPLTILNEAPMYSASIGQHALQQQHHYQQQMYGQQGMMPSAQGLPVISSGISGTWAQQTAPTQPPIPRPPLRSRPLSAGSARRSTFDMPRLQPVPSAVGTPVSRQGWVTQVAQRGNMGNPSSPQAALDLGQQQEKDQRISQLTEEVTRLRTFEFESLRKDQLIQLLQQQISSQSKRRGESSSFTLGVTTNGKEEDGEHVEDSDQKARDTNHRVVQLETEVTIRKAEISALKEQLSQYQSEGAGSPLMLRQELGERVKEVTSLRLELERLKKDKTSTSTLVTQVQREMSSKESTISKLTKEIEVLKKDLKDRDKLLATANTKVEKIREASNSSKIAEERDARERELISLRQRFKAAEVNVSEHFNTITSLRQEVDTAKAALGEEKEMRLKYQTHLESSKAHIADLEQTQKSAQVQLERLQGKFETFRTRVRQSAHSETAAQSSDITDDQLMETLKKVVAERSEWSSKVATLQDELTVAVNSTQQLTEDLDKLRVALQQSVDGVKDSGRVTASLQQAVSTIGSLPASNLLLWIRDMVAAIFTVDLECQEGIEAALVKCGIECQLSSTAPGKHVELLWNRCEALMKEKETMMTQMADIEAQHAEDCRQKLEALRQELDSKMVEALEKTRLEGDERVNKAIEDIKALEEEKVRSAVAAEKQSNSAQWEATVEKLKKDVAERQEEVEKHQREWSEALEEVEKHQRQWSEAVEEVERYKVLEMEYKEQLSQLETRLKIEVEQSQEEKEAEVVKKGEEVESFKEQVRQHSVTICSLEQRLSDLNHNNRDLQNEITFLSNARAELQAEVERLSQTQKPALPPKPKVIIQRPTEELNALEQVVGMLRQENVELKASITEQQDIILGLRRDLSGASARLSDITGEMSESQKQEMEKNRELIVRRDTEVVELRQQMAKLSKIIDKQKGEIVHLKEELSQKHSVLEEHRRDLEDRNSRLLEMEGQLKDEQAEQKKQLELLDQEGRITSELVGIGAQCRGERHDHIIMRQREALAELRSRVKTLEQSRPPLPSQDQALQQVVMLKKELAEMRAQQALAEDSVLSRQAILDRQAIGALTDVSTKANTDADMERSAHRQTMDTLEKSEHTFLALLKAMATSLELEEIQGLRAMAHLPKDEREHLMAERDAACQLLSNRIQVLKERVARKDELLQGYENDLAKLRQSQHVAEKKTAQVDNLTQDVRSRAEEAQYLRETLNRARDRLNQEKRLNTAIKQKKTFHLENERMHLQPQRTDDSGCKDRPNSASVRRKQQKEVMKKKNYEIRTLKEELCDKEQALYDREKRLMSLETSLGLERPVEVLEG